MKKFKLPKWKTKRRIGFRLYYMLFVSLILCLSVACSVWVEELWGVWLTEKLKIPGFVVVIVSTLLIGFAWSWFIARFTLLPIKAVRDAMNEVAEGNFDVHVNEDNRFDEIEDITHAFNVMVKELRSTEIIQSDFISNVSHEIKTPLTVIDGYVTMLENEDLSKEEREEYLKKIQFNTRRLTDLTQNVLLMSKLDNQGIDRKKEDFFLDEQIRREIIAMESKIADKNILLEADLQSIRFNGNSGLISHLWANLLGNAIKFSPENGKIFIQLTVDGKNIRFSVSDEGNGVSEEEKKYIFNKFYQSDTSRKQEGNGLGLSIVKKIVEIYCGEIIVENLEPKGCKFTVLLPIE